MQSYLLKSSIALLILYAAYCLLLRNKTSHQLNRLVILFCLLFSCIVPIISLPSFTPIAETKLQTFVITQSINIEESISQKIPQHSISIFSIVYICGVVLLLFRTLAGLATLLKFYYFSPKSRNWGFKVINVNQNMSPFTFFNLLFIGKEKLSTTEMEPLVMHEAYHRNQFHSFDALLLELLTALFWFNPAIWFFQREIKALHEYLADEFVLKKGFDVVEYQHLLFKVKTGISLQFGNYLKDKISLKNRINMMTINKNNSKINYWRTIFFLPFIAAIIGLNACTENNLSLNPENPAIYEGGIETLYTHIKKTIKYPLSAKNEQRTGTVNVTFTVDEHGEIKNIHADRDTKVTEPDIKVIAYSSLSGANQKNTGENPDLEAEVIRCISSATGKFTPANTNGEAVSSKTTLSINFNLLYEL